MKSIINYREYLDGLNGLSRTNEGGSIIMKIRDFIKQNRRKLDDCIISALTRYYSLRVLDKYKAKLILEYIVNGKTEFQSISI